MSGQDWEARYRDAVRAWRHTGAEREALRVEVERLRGLLARLEWAGYDHRGGACPVCGAAQGPEHYPDCWLAAELK